MRRNKKYNVYTNRTIKRNHYNYYFCECCKSYCKAYYLNNELPDKRISGHNYYPRRKLHQIGIGSLLPGKTMISIINKKNLDDYYPKNSEIKRKRQVLEELYSEVWLSEFMYRADLLYGIS